MAKKAKDSETIKIEKKCEREIEGINQDYGSKIEKLKGRIEYLEEEQNRYIIYSLENVIYELVYGEAPEKVIKYSDKILKLDPKNETALLYKGKALTKLKRYEDALVYQDKLLEIYPEYASALYDKGGTLIRAGRFEEGLKHLDRAKEIEPELISEIFWLLMGIELKEKEKYEEALICYDRSLEIKPNEPSSLEGKMKVLEKLGRAEEAGLIPV